MAKNALRSVRKADIPVIVRELERIEHRDKLITAEAVLRAATPATSPLHKFFEWNNSKAAEEFRLFQARRLIQSVSVVYEEDDTKRNRGFVHLKVETSSGETSGYVSTVRAMSDTEMREQVLERARKEMLDWRNRYRDLNELAEIFRAIDEAT